MNYKRNNKGFTLIELLVALSIISILSLAFFKIFNSSIKYNTKNEKDIKALNIAQSEVENLRKEIKLSKSQIIIYDKDKQPLIRIPESEKVIWVSLDEHDKSQIIEVNENYEYIGKNHSGDNNRNTLQYERRLEEDNTPYIVDLGLTRHKKADKFIYDIEVKVSLKNKNLSKKETILNTSILSK